MKLAPRASVLLALCLAAGAASAQVSLTGPAYTQDFDTLANSGTTNAALPAGWLLSESGNNADGLYAAGTGSSNSGNSYSFGASGSTERALGGLLSGSLNPTFGACFTNNVGNEVTALDIAYTGEQWRSGSTGRTDTINFQYSLDATGLTDGSWVDVDALDFSTLNADSTGAKNGNDVAFRAAVSSQIGGLAIANGSGFCIRWTDVNASGADDGLAVDDFSLTPVFEPPTADLALDITSATAQPIVGNAVTVRSGFTNATAIPGGAWSYALVPPAVLTPTSFGAVSNENGMLQSCGFTSTAGATVTCNGTTPASSASSIEWIYSIPDGTSGPLVFSGTVTGPAEDQTLENNSARLVVTLAGQEADLSVSLADNADPVVPGGTLTYTATVANDGPGAALGLSLSLPLPANTTYVDSSFDPSVFDACAVVSDALQCSGSTLFAAGESTDVTLVVNVDASFLGALDASATVVSEVVDLAPANNSDSEATQVAVPRLAIHEVQGAGTLSPLDGSLVEIEGIVTALRFNNGFFVQTVPGQEDADPMTSEGLFVFTGGAPTVAVGDRVVVSGFVEEYRSSSNPHQGFVTEIVDPSISVDSSGNALPAPVQITAEMMDPALPVETLEYLEGMRVSVDRLVAVAPTEGSLFESDAEASANGNFWGVIEGIARPFREPGVGVQDVGPALPVNTPRFDTNPERLRIQSRGQIGAGILVVDTGAVVTGLVGVLDYGFGTYILMPDPDASLTVEGGAMPVPVSDPAKGEFTIASANMLRFYDTVNDPGGDVALSEVAFERRLTKASMAICDFMKAPDIVGVVEVENLATLQALADRLNAGCSREPQYQAYLEDGNDGSNINVGFLVNAKEVRPSVPRVEVLSVVQYGKDAVITNPNNSTSVMNDRPPLVLRAELSNAEGLRTPVTVIANHLLSLIDINDNDPGSNGYASNGERRRNKRAEQAVFLAGLVEQFQQANPDERIVLLGDFNAFEFSDGYVDVMGIISGLEAGPDAVLQHADSPLTTPLTNLTSLVPADGRYSFSFEGNAQSLDHILVNQALLRAFPGLRIEHARINADFAVDNFEDETIPVRMSDHDPVVLYLAEAGRTQADLWLDLEPVNRVIEPAERNVVLVNLSNLGPDLLVTPTVNLMVQARPEEIDLAAPANWACSKTPVQILTLVNCRVAGGLVAGELQTLELGISLAGPVRIRRLDILGWAESPSNDRNALNGREALKMPVNR